MKTGLILAALVAALALGAGSASADECRHEAQRGAVLDAAGVERLEVLARAGALVVTGRSDATAVRVRGRACAADEELLEKIELVAEPHGDAIRIEAKIPEDASWRTIFGGNYAELDLTDGSGALTIHDTQGAARIVDGSGSIRVERVGGDFIVHNDGSGGVSYGDVDGRIEVPGDD